MEIDNEFEKGDVGILRDTRKRLVQAQPANWFL